MLWRPRRGRKAIKKNEGLHKKGGALRDFPLRHSLHLFAPTRTTPPHTHTMRAVVAFLALFLVRVYERATMHLQTHTHTQSRGPQGGCQPKKNRTRPRAGGSAPALPHPPPPPFPSSSPQAVAAAVEVPYYGNNCGPGYTKGNPIDPADAACEFFGANAGREGGDARAESVAIDRGGLPSARMPPRSLPIAPQAHAWAALRSDAGQCTADQGLIRAWRAAPSSLPLREC